MTNVALIGGGRWGRVHASVLNEILGENDRLIWLSQYGQTDALQRAAGRANLVICRDLDDCWEHAPDCCIIATAPHRHAGYVKDAIMRRLPVLVEKPICLAQHDFDDIQRLAGEHGTPLGINLEFLYASYLREFAARISSVDVRSIEIVWHDTATEMRYGEVKSPDYFTHQVDDMFPHCWSILRLFSAATSFSPMTANARADGRIELAGVLGKANVHVSLTRFHPRRERQVRVNGEWLVDFAEEPGFTVAQNERTINTWRGDRPMKRSLLNFLDVVTGRLSPTAWPVAMQHCAESFVATHTAGALARRAQRKWLAAHWAYSDNRLLDEASNLLLDLFLPEQALAGHRPPVSNTIDRREISALALSQYRNEKPDEPIH